MKVVSLGGIIISNSLRIGGDKFDNSIINYIRKICNLLIGQRTAEEIKISLSSVLINQTQEKSIEIKGIDLISNLPKTMVVTESQVREALKEPVALIIDAIKRTSEDTPPELSSDIIENGITLAGGGALLHGLDTLISNEPHIPVHIA